MIITKKKALALVASDKVIKALPELFKVAEKYKDKKKEFDKKKDCPKCKVNEFFNSVQDAAFVAFQEMSPASVQKLQKVLETKEPIYLYISDEKGVRTIELGK